jgi:hypothetical protein
VCGSLALTSLAVPAVAAELAEPDAAVLALVQRCWEAVQAWDAASSLADDISEEFGELSATAAEEHASTLWDAWQELEAQLVDTRAVTMKGLHAKARYVRHHEDQKMEHSIVLDLCALA